MCFSRFRLKAIAILHLYRSTFRSLFMLKVEQVVKIELVFLLFSSSIN